MYEKTMTLGLPDKQQETIIVTNNVTPIKRLLTMLYVPALLAVFLFIILLMENNFNLPSLLFPIVIFSFIAAPFAFAVSYAMWKDLETKIILTNEKIIRKQPRGKEFHISWNDIKTITILNRGNTEVKFTRKKQNFLSNRDNHIHCPPGFLFTNNLSKEAANFILKKIDFYKIPIKGKRKFLEEISKTPHKSLRRKGFRS